MLNLFDKFDMQLQHKKVFWWRQL